MKAKLKVPIPSIIKNDNAAGIELKKNYLKSLCGWRL